MKEKTTPYIRGLSGLSSISLQYFEKEYGATSAYTDPLMEDRHEVIKGLVHKYENRALIKVSYQCAAHCRFCTRIRQIGNPGGTLTADDIAGILRYLKAHPEIDDVILSGGDPFYTPQITSRILEGIQAVASVKVLRIGTRLPFHSPVSFRSKSITELLSLIHHIGKEKPFYILLHIEHPDELTMESEAVIALLGQQKVTLLSQTVFLKDINDDADVLYTLFKRLYHSGVMPYYLYHCDEVKGLERFYGDKEKEKRIAVELRKRLSGIACPLFVEDITDGYGKIPVV